MDRIEWLQNMAWIASVDRNDIQVQFPLCMVDKVRCGTGRDIDDDFQMDHMEGLSHRICHMLTTAMKTNRKILLIIFEE